MALGATLAFDGFRTASYLPADVRALGAGRLDGRIEAQGDLAKSRLRLGKIDLRLARATAGGLPRELRLRGRADASPALARTEGLTVSVPGARGHGARVVRPGAPEASTSAWPPAPPSWPRLLKDMGLPPLAQGARLDAHATGPLADPTRQRRPGRRGAGRRAAPGAPPGRAGRARARAPAARKALRPRVRGPPGRARHRAAADLQARTARGGARGRSAARGARHRSGRAGAGQRRRGATSPLSADAHGPLDAPTAHLNIPAGTAIRLLDDTFLLGPVDVALDGRNADIKSLHVAHKGGGSADVRGRVALGTQELSLDVALDAFPLAALPGVADSRRRGDRARRRAPAHRRTRRAASDRGRDRPARRRRAGRAPGHRPPGPLAGHRRADARAGRLRSRPALRSLRPGRRGGADPRRAGRARTRRVSAPGAARAGARAGGAGRRARHRDRSGRHRPRSRAAARRRRPLARAVAVHRPPRRGTERRDDAGTRAHRGGAPAARPRRRRPHRPRRGAVRDRRRRPSRAGAPRRAGHLGRRVGPPGSRAAASRSRAARSIGWAAICAPS